jgi:hypothetical protein
VRSFVNDLERPIGTYLYGRRMYGVMVYWETAHSSPTSPLVQEFREIWLLVPVLAGGGKEALPNKVRLQLELLDEQRFSSGVFPHHCRTRDVRGYNG